MYIYIYTHTHIHTPVVAAAMQSASLTTGSKLGFSVFAPQGYLVHMWTGGGGIRIATLVGWGAVNLKGWRFLLRKAVWILQFSAASTLKGCRQ